MDGVLAVGLREAGRLPHTMSGQTDMAEVGSAEKPRMAYMID
jgi:hypothetical protein